MISRTAGRLCYRSVEPQRRQIEVLDERVHHPHRVFLTDVIFKPLGEQHTLRAIHPFYKSAHRLTLVDSTRQFYSMAEFSHSLGRKQSFQNLTHTPESTCAPGLGQSQQSVQRVPESVLPPPPPELPTYWMGYDAFEKTS